jgi:hypothetical protein
MTAEPQADERRMKQCYYCAEPIRADAIKCRFCRSDVSRPPPRERLRLFSSSPWVAILSLAFGVLGGSAEALNLFDVFGSNDTPTAPSFFPDTPNNQVDDGERVAVLVAALAVGSGGFLAALVARRRRGLALILFIGAGLAGLAVSVLIATNLVLVVLSVLLLALAAAMVLASRRAIRYRPRRLGT